MARAKKDEKEARASENGSKMSNAQKKE